MTRTPVYVQQFLHDMASDSEGSESEEEEEDGVGDAAAAEAHCGTTAGP